MATKKKRKKGKGKGNGAGAPDVEANAADVGARMLLALKDELIAIKNPGNPKQNVWGTLSEIQQDEILDRFGKRIEHELVRGYQAILAGGVPAVHAHLAKVAFAPKGIQAALEIPQASAHRHALADFAGQDVLVILTEDLEEYTSSMAAIQPDRDQKELELGEGEAAGEPIGEPADPDIDSDPRTLEELREAAVEAAKGAGEDDIDAATVSTWSRAHLLDYIAWASGGAALVGEHPAGALPAGHQDE